MSQVDIYASMAALVGLELAEGEAMDSQNHLDAWLGRSGQGRTLLLRESVGGLSLRDGNWKYIVPFAGKQLPDWLPAKGIEGGISTEAQLYNLDSDLGEQVNIAEHHPDRVSDMQATVDKIMQRGY
jgi:hypothetical protein